MEGTRNKIWLKSATVSLALLMLFAVTACSQEEPAVDTTTPEYALTTLLDMMIAGDVNNGAALYCENGELIAVDPATSPDDAAITAALYKRMEYTIVNIEDQGSSATAQVTITTSDFAEAAANAYDDPGYLALSEEEKSDRYDDYLINHIIENSLAGKNVTKTVELTMVDDGRGWKVQVDDDFAKAVKGINY